MICESELENMQNRVTSDKNQLLRSEPGGIDTDGVPLKVITTTMKSGIFTNSLSSVSNVRDVMILNSVLKLHFQIYLHTFFFEKN
jgi:hypothetical protein